MKKILLAGLILPVAALVCACGGAARRTEPEPTAKRAAYEVLHSAKRGNPPLLDESVLVDPKATRAEVLALAEWLRWYHETNDGGYREIVIWDSAYAFGLDGMYAGAARVRDLTEGERRRIKDEVEPHCLVDMIGDPDLRLGSEPEIRWVGPADHP